MMDAVLKKYFWDTDFDKLDARAHKTYIIERLMEFGDEEAVRFLKENYSEEELRETLKASRGLSRRSASFWAHLFDVPFNKILCLKKPYRQLRAAHWIE